MELFSVEQMQAAQQLNQEALGQEGFAQYNLLIQKSTIFAMPLNKEEQKQMAEFTKLISEHRATQHKEPKKQEFINMIEVMKSLGFKPAELKNMISGANVGEDKPAKITLKLGTFKLADFGTGAYANKPADATTYEVVLGASPKGQGWEAKFVSDFKKDAEKVVAKLSKEVKDELCQWVPKKRGIKAEFPMLTKFFAMFGINDDKTQAQAKVWVKKLGHKFPTDAEITAKIEAAKAPVAPPAAA